MPTVGSCARPEGDGPWRFAREDGDEDLELRTVEVRRGAAEWELVVDSGGEVTVPCADGGWPSVATPEGPLPFVATGGWTAPGVFEARVVAVETPHSLLLRCSAGRVEARWSGRPLHSPRLADQVAYQPVLLNGEPGLLRYIAGRLESAQAFVTDGERIVAIYAIRNPDKLAGIPLTLG